MRFHIENFGCRAARADGEAVSASLRVQGLTESPFAEADLVLLNTCSVTAEADRDARAFIRKTRRNNPGAKILVTGCYAQRAPEEVAALEGVTAVIGNSHKALLPTLIPNLLEIPQSSSAFIPTATLLTPNHRPIWADDQFAHSFLEEAPLAPGATAGTQTRPNLKIQEGCSSRCTFCIIPTTRGHSRSLPAEKILAQTHSFVANGGHELVLSGINLGRWGRDLPGSPSFPGLIRQIIETALSRLRLSSIEPMDWTPDLIALLREYTPSARIARHAHLPLQSGSDSVLRRMHRRYRPWHYEQKVATLAEAVGSQLALGADVMVGFPGETEAEFRETADLISKLPFTYLHLFPFSPRPGTPGWQLHQQSPVSQQAVHERMAHLRALATEKSQAFRHSQIGATLPAITLHTPAETTAQDHTVALTDNFLQVELAAALPANQLIHLRLRDSNTATLTS